MDTNQIAAFRHGVERLRAANRAVEDAKDNLEKVEAQADAAERAVVEFVTGPACQSCRIQDGTVIYSIVGVPGSCDRRLHTETFHGIVLPPEPSP